MDFKQLPFSFSSRTGVIIIGGFSVLVLMSVFFFQYALDVVPCVLCYTERYPFYMALVICLVAYFGPSKIRRFSFLLLILVFLWSTFMGVHHMGVEWKFWQGPTDCSGISAVSENPMDLLAQLDTVKLVNCAEPNFFLFGLSLAVWNTIASLFALIVSALFWQKSGSYVANDYSNAVS